MRQCHDQYTTVQSAAAMFAIGGSYLALGAIALVFTLTLAADEYHPRGERPAVRDATLFFFCAATLISLLCVVWGYRDAVWVIQEVRLPAHVYLFSHYAAWWGLAGLLMGSGIAVVSHRLLVRRVRRIEFNEVRNMAWLRYSMIGVVLLYIASPVLWYLMIQGTQPGERPVGSNLLTQVMFAWVTVSIGFFTYWLPHFSGTRERLITLRPIEDDPEPVMSTRATSTIIRTLDGLRLAGTFLIPEVVPQHAVVLVHGGGVTREEGGFFTRLAAGLGKAGLASLRFDLRGHGESEGLQQDLTLSAILNDIRAAIAHLRAETGAESVSLLGASFGGGICGYYAAKRPEEIARLVLLNPQFDYKQRTVDSRPYWTDDYLDDENAQRLADRGYIDFTPTLRHGRAILNEVFWLKPNEVLGEIKAPTLVVHGTKDTLVPIESSRAAMVQFRAEHRLVEIEGAQHGFAVHDDPQYRNSQSQEWQASVVRMVSEWLTSAV